MALRGKFQQIARLAAAATAAISAGMILGTAPAWAVCSPAAGSNITATCSGDTVNQNNPFGYGSGAGNNVTVTVQSGATVTGTNVGILFGNNITIDNAGSILGGNGVLTTGSLAALINSGSITGTGAGNSGVNAASIGSLVNSGSIAATGNNGQAVNSTGPIGSLVNSGSIAGSLNGINANGAIGSLVNSGSIVGSNFGISATSIASLVNSGSISGNTAVNATTIGSLTNSGLISGRSFAIRETGAGDTSLTLLAGSVIIGGIDLGGGTNVLNVGNGLSIVNTFTGAAPLVGNTYGAPYAVRGNQVAVLDPTTLANTEQMLVDLTDAIFSTLQGRLYGLRSGFSGTTVTSKTGPMGLGMGKGYATDLGAPLAREFWVQGFGARRNQEANAPTVGSDQRLAGFISGVDAPITALTVGGLYFGGSWADTSADIDPQSTSANSAFGGLYTSTMWGATLIDLAIVGGWSDFDRSRQVANNLAPNGIQIAEAKYSGWFIAPEARLTHPLIGNLDGVASIRYAGLFVDGFQETGAADNFTLDSQDIHLGIARLGVALPMEHASGSILARLVLTGGVEGYTQLGGQNLQGALLGQDIVFNPGGNSSVIALYGGAEAQLIASGGAIAFAAFEGLIEDDDANRVSGKVGIRVPF
jgi:hypothetical protein